MANRLTMAMVAASDSASSRNIRSMLPALNRGRCAIPAPGDIDQAHGQSIPASTATAEVMATASSTANRQAPAGVAMARSPP